MKYCTCFHSLQALKRLKSVPKLNPNKTLGIKTLYGLCNIFGVFNLCFETALNRKILAGLIIYKS